MELYYTALKSILPALACVEYQNMLLVLVMYSLNIITFKNNKMFWLSILLPGYFLFQSKLSKK